MINYINNEIIQLSQGLVFNINDYAPSTEIELFNSTSLVIWSGASDNTIYQDAKINYAFRAIHDNIHLKTGLGFSPIHEIEMGRIQANILANQCKSLLAEYFMKNNQFVQDQVQFTKNFLNI